MSCRQADGRRPRGMLNSPDIRDVPVYIYALCEPDTGEIRYVGRSSNPRNRITSHRKWGATRVVLWLVELRARGLGPQLRILTTVNPGADATVAEIAAIAEHASDRLLNSSGPGVRKLDAAELLPLRERLIELGVRVPAIESCRKTAASVLNRKRACAYRELRGS